MGINTTKDHNLVFKPVVAVRGYRSSYVITLIVFLSALAATWLLWSNEQEHAQQKVHVEFDFRAHEANSHIEQRMLAYEQVLRGFAGLLSHASTLSRQEFYQYYSRLHLEENYPGIEGVAFLPLITPSQLNEHQAEIRKEGFPDYQLHPQGVRGNYAPVIYIEPLTRRNMAFLGDDLFAVPAHRAAMKLARDRNEAAISGMVRSDDNSGQINFAMYLPIYANGSKSGREGWDPVNIKGWVSAIFRMNDLMPDILRDHSMLLDFEIYDGAVMLPKTLMFDSDNDPGSRLEAQYQKISKIDIAGHTWTVATRSHTGFEAQQWSEKAQFISRVGVGVSILLALLTWLLTTSRMRALIAAREMTQGLFESESRYR